MRILSQDGNYDFPYDKVCLQILDNGKIVAQGDIWNYANEENWIAVAEYGSFEKAKKAMEMLWKAYSPIAVIQEQENGIKPNTKPNDWVIQPALLMPKVEVLDNFYFQFPADEEIEV